MAEMTRKGFLGMLLGLPFVAKMLDRDDPAEEVPEPIVTDQYWWSTNIVTTDSGDVLSLYDMSASNRIHHIYPSPPLTYTAGS